jgi:hypothetical protein
MTMPDRVPHPASFRDPSGFVFRSEGRWYRQVNDRYAGDYRRLMDSGLYDTLTKKNWLIPHTEVDPDQTTGTPGHFKTLLPQQLPFIGYPCEWSPEQLKDAALLTLAIVRLSIGYGMILKDATPLNIQFVEGRALFIDTLSFEQYDASRPWIAYRQFCECFLFPLLLHHYHRQGVHRTLLAYPEGIPAVVTLSLLPLKSRFRPGVWLHVFLPGRIREGSGDKGKTPAFDKHKLRLLIDNLESTIRGLRTASRGAGGWSAYYRDTILGPSYLLEKEKLFREMIAGVSFASALDLGANDGYFSKILAEKKALVLAADADWACISNLYGSAGAGTPLYPLCVDIADPTPAAGFANKERSPLSERAQSDLVTALALVHHLVLGRNIPLGMVAGYFATLTRYLLIVEFVPSTDKKAMELTRNKSFFHTPYDAASFEAQFGLYFTIQRRSPVPGTERVLYLMSKNNPSL